MTGRSLVVCVYCSSSIRIDQQYLDLAGAVGAELGRRGHSLVSGGGGLSMMGAVARAARDAGAHTIGVIPRPLLDLEVADHDADELVVTETMRERKAEMDARADAFLALPGGIGTLEELLEIWTARVLALHSKPVVVLDPDGLYAPLRAQTDDLVAKQFMRPGARDTLGWATTVPDAFTLLEAAQQPGAPLAPSIQEQLEGE